MLQSAVLDGDSLISSIAPWKSFPLISRYSAHVTARNNGPRFKSTSLGSGPTDNPLGGPQKYAAENRAAERLTITRWTALLNRPLEKTWRRSPATTMREPSTGVTGSHRAEMPSSAQRTCKPLLPLVWWSIVMRAESVWAAIPIALAGSGHVGYQLSCSTPSIWSVIPLPSSSLSPSAFRTSPATCCPKVLIFSM